MNDEPEVKTPRKRLRTKAEAPADVAEEGTTSEQAEASVEEAPAASKPRNTITIVSDHAFNIVVAHGDPPIEIKKGANVVPTKLKDHYALKIHKCVIKE